MKTIEEYIKINSSFEKICIYRIGNHAGFFSEINNMIIAMVYCLENGIKFQLYSTNAMYCDDLWKDFFHPFTEHATHPFHIIHNTRDYETISAEDFSSQEHYEIKEYLDETFSTQEPFLTQNIWPYIRDRSIYNSEHNINTPFISGSIINVCYQIIQSIWNYKSDVRQKIDKIKSSIKIETPYAGIHIRRGDKFREAPFEPLSSYFDIVDRVTQKEDYPVFIATDDQRIIEDIQNLYPKRLIYHFNFPENTGFDMNDFQPLDSEQQIDKIIKLFAEIEMLIKANMFVGTFTSNVGMFIGMARNGQDIYGVDTLNWIVW